MQQLHTNQYNIQFTVWQQLCGHHNKVFEHIHMTLNEGVEQSVGINLQPPMKAFQQLLPFSH